MRHFASLSAVAILLASGTALAQNTAQFDTARLSQHVQTLGSDAFEGRAPATAGETKTVQYLSQQFAAAGLQPGGDMVNGQRSWTQAVPLLRSEFSATPHVAMNIGGKATELNQETNELKKVYLREMPIDPMTGESDWKLRSSYQEGGDDSWDQINVFDVRSASTDEALNGEKYSEW